MTICLLAQYFISYPSFKVKSFFVTLCKYYETKQLLCIKLVLYDAGFLATTGHTLAGLTK